MNNTIEFKLNYSEGLLLIKKHCRKFARLINNQNINYNDVLNTFIDILVNRNLSVTFENLCFIVGIAKSEIFQCKKQIVDYCEFLNINFIYRKKINNSKYVNLDYKFNEVKIDDEFLVADVVENEIVLNLRYSKNINMDRIEEFITSEKISNSTVVYIRRLFQKTFNELKLNSDRIATELKKSLLAKAFYN